MLSLPWRVRHTAAGGVQPVADAQAHPSSPGPSSCAVLGSLLPAAGGLLAGIGACSDGEDLAA